MNYSEQFLASVVAAHARRIRSSTHIAAMVFASQRKDGAKLSDIARLVNISSAAVTGIADTLESMGLVERKRIPGDRRAWLLTITAKGRDALDMILNPKPTTKP